ncbi:MAG TPA: DUF1569 domain-containing protein [Kofleriaceae bacterium]|nr:DUF1569 domain-containing protein [Kofleriaceae bacterium]
MSGKLTTFDEVLAATAGELPVASGSRTTAQHLDHCAASIVASLDGYPALKPWIVRATVGKLVKYVFLWRGTMHHDTSAPVPGGPTLPDRPVAEAQAALAAAVERFRAHGGGLRPHPVYGGCSKAQYERLHSIHAADHLRTIRGQA